MSAEALRKGVIYGRWVRAGRETGPSRRRWYIVDQTRLNPCWERPFGLHNELEPEVKMEIPVKCDPAKRQFAIHATGGIDGDADC